MGMKSVQVRLSEEQLAEIDSKVKAGEYPSCSEAIRSYLRKAQTWELLERLLELSERKDQIEVPVLRDLERLREEVYREYVTPKRKRKRREKRA
ncbi:MAG: ribbon-helix-helix domain-containing protein [Candidatus Bipolaricaulia bacterium]